MQIRFLLGPAGSGKTYRCLAEVRTELARSPEGPPLILLSPKQATFQLERQLLAEPSLQGYARLRILSFERLAHFIFEQLQQPLPRLLDEEGRLMVLRALLARRRGDLKLFRASSRLAGFAQQLSRVLHELQQNRLTPESLLELSARTPAATGLAAKLHDLSTLLRNYLDWLTEHKLHDNDCLLAEATKALQASRSPVPGSRPEAKGQLDLFQQPAPNLPFSGFSLWLDGFAEFSTQELELLAAVVGRCGQATLAFCLDREPRENVSWLSTWSQLVRSFSNCRNRLREIPGASVSVELLARDGARSRFQKSLELAHLEKHWAETGFFSPGGTSLATEVPIRGSGQNETSKENYASLRAVTCPNPEAEATLAAREILRFVQAGGRFRDVSVVVRTLEGYSESIQRTFARYDIPFFLDQREAVAHHPLAELTRSALRLVAFQWPHEDWFAALKTGLVTPAETEVDRLENEALARGWEGAAWQQPLQIADDPERARHFEQFRLQLVPPFQKLVLRLSGRQNKPAGPELATAIRELWRSLDVENQLDSWSTEGGVNFELPASSFIHSTVWDQMNTWLDNIERAFPAESLSLREWLPILEAGLAGLTVGVIPPALDQVLIGAIDRSRNPDILFALVLGLNEGIFPAPPAQPALLTDADREELERHNLVLGLPPREQLGRERYLAYIACTRPRQRLLLTCSAFDPEGKPLNPSPFLARVQQLFPNLELESLPRLEDWRESVHPNEIIAPLLRVQSRSSNITEPTKPEILDRWQQIARVPRLKLALDRLRHFQVQDAKAALSPGLAEQLFGPTLRTSVSRIEQFAACPFRFFVHSGLRAEERKTFELDTREQGSFQHDALALFHEQLKRENKRWRDLTPAEARERIGVIARALRITYRDGLLQTSAENRFTAEVLTTSLQDFVETLIGWMRGQYQFDPVAVELPFGENDEHPAWQLDLGDGHRLALRGRIDRVDLYRESTGDESWCVVVDYKSSQKYLDAVLVANGLQLQLLAYLNVLRHWPGPREDFGVEGMVPAGVFYVNLRGKYQRSASRADALAEIEEARKLAYRHTGRFDARALRKLDARGDAQAGDQFNYRLKNDGELSKASREALSTDQFHALLDSVESNLQRMGREIFAGVARVEPFRKGTMTACQQCEYLSICRFDSWEQKFRVLRQTESEEPE